MSKANPRTNRMETRFAARRDAGWPTLSPFCRTQKVPSQVNYKPLPANLIVGLVSGGVIVNPERVYDQTVSVARGPVLDETRSKVVASPRVDAHRWWWDAER